MTAISGITVTVSEESKMLDRFKPLLTHVKYVDKKDSPASRNLKIDLGLERRSCSSSHECEQLLDCRPSCRTCSAPCVSVDTQSIGRITSKNSVSITAMNVLSSGLPFGSRRDELIALSTFPYIIAADLFISRCCSSSRNANAMNETTCKAIPRLPVDNDCED